MSIDVKVTAVGGPEVAERFSRATSAMRGLIQQELDDIGAEIVSDARARVPRRTGRTLSRIVFRHGNEKSVRIGGRRINVFAPIGSGPLKLTVLPGEPTAHLLERGVDATVKVRRSRAGDVYDYGARIVRRKGRYIGVERSAARRPKRERVAMGVQFVKPYRLHVAAKPYFSPAVQSVGGASGVNERLQGAIDRIASTVDGRAG